MSQPISTRPSKALCAAAIAAVSMALATNVVYAQSSFWDTQNEGWFFYEEPEPIEEVQEEEPPEVKPVIIPPPAPADEESQPEPEKPAYLSAKWLKDNLPRYHQAALDNPNDIQTVAVYAYLKRVALDKAEQFTRTYQDALLKFPVLDENTNRSTASFATKAMDGAAQEASLRMLQMISERTLGLFFFYKKDCEVCIAQTHPLEWVRKRGGFDIQPISLDGSPLPITGFENFAVDKGQAEMLGIVTAPAVYLVIDPQTFVSVGQGGTAAHDLANAIISQARMNGVITEEEYQTTRPSRMNPLGDSFEQMIEAKAVQAEEDGFIDPAGMFEIIKGEISG